MVNLRGIGHQNGSLKVCMYIEKDPGMESLDWKRPRNGNRIGEQMRKEEGEEENGHS